MSTSKGKSKAPEQTLEEVKYLRRLVEQQIPIRIKMEDNTEVSGTVEYYDARFIRISRQDGPNLFLFKHDIKYFHEEP